MTGIFNTYVFIICDISMATAHIAQLREHIIHALQYAKQSNTVECVNTNRYLSLLNTYSMFVVLMTFIYYYISEWTHAISM